MVLNADVWAKVMERLSSFETDDDVANFLRGEGVTAIRSDAHECALAVWLKSVLGENKMVSVATDYIKVFTTENKTWGEGEVSEWESQYWGVNPPEDWGYHTYVGAQVKNQEYFNSLLAEWDRQTTLSPSGEEMLVMTTEEYYNTHILGTTVQLEHFEAKFKIVPALKAFIVNFDRGHFPDLVIEEGRKRAISDALTYEKYTMDQARGTVFAT